MQNETAEYAYVSVVSDEAEDDNMYTFSVSTDLEYEVNDASPKDLSVNLVITDVTGLLQFDDSVDDLALCKSFHLKQNK